MDFMARKEKPKSDKEIQAFKESRNLREWSLAGATRMLALCSEPDDEIMVSGSVDEMRVWSVRTGDCIYCLDMTGGSTQ